MLERVPISPKLFDVGRIRDSLFVLESKIPMTGIPLGRYRHYKNKEYTVLGIARHSETEEELVVYRQEYGERGLWVRPKAMFLETVEIDGQRIPRFQHIPESKSQ